MQRCHWRGIVIAIPPSPNVIYFVMKYEVTFDKGCSAINFMLVKGPKLHRCYVLQLHEESIASWCCTLISRQHLLFGAWRVAELAGDYRVRAHNPLEEEAIWRCGSGYLSGSLCTPVFIFACDFCLFYNAALWQIFKYIRKWWKYCKVKSHKYWIFSNVSVESQILKCSYDFKVYCPQTT
jgi:hypothetical protein